MLKLPDLAIILDCSTRWNSTKNMIDRFLAVKEAYKLKINSDDDARKNCSLNDEQIQYITIVNEVLSKFEKITVWLSSQQYTTINKTIVLFNRLFDQLYAFQESNPHLAEAIECCKDKLSNYYPKTDLTSVYANSTLVDPSLKFSYCTAVICRAIHRNEAGPSMLADMDIDSSDSIYSTSEDEDIVGSTLSKLQDERHTKVQLIEGNDKIIKHYVETNADLKRYLDIDHRIEYKSKLKLRKSKLQNDDDGDDEIEHEDEVAMTNMELGKKYATLPLKFWKQHENLLPTLSLFARKHLSIPATSVPAERLFSQAKYIVEYVHIYPL
ncbi:hypothetical protein INT46_001618 [Mucor plumbeus]|uniref:HAT C-terminal dimerisation domain-containing protein n=1 Tax=Mucor plumbeus TaxID=97098 RepID=A0A8H7VAB5_9FUNG|nr:hypothetical protein INT46_001618 [Mucor plumbeus]